MTSFIASSVSADPIKGQRLLTRAIHDDCIFPASRLAMMHSQAEWDAIYKSGNMEKEVAKLCKRKTPLKPFDTRYSKYADYIHEFMNHYANDSGAVPA